MKTLLATISILLFLSGCSDKKEAHEYPVIDIVNNAGHYQRVYCSDYFSSIELIPLETNEKCLLEVVPYPRIKYKDGFIFMKGNRRIYAFDRSGKFLNQIGENGQGVGEYILSSTFFFNKDKQSIFVEDLYRVLEYDFKGNFIRSFPRPDLDSLGLTGYAHVRDSLFIVHMNYRGNNRYNYCLVDQSGDIVKGFPNPIFFNRIGGWVGTEDGALDPMQIDDRLYLKDYINDTIYTLTDLDMQPAYVFDRGIYTHPKEALEIFDPKKGLPDKHIRFGVGLGIVGTPKFFFYEIYMPETFPRPEAKAEYHLIYKDYRPKPGVVFGLYDIEQKTNTLLDTDDHFQKGIINDLNGGLPLIPRYYAGNGVVIDVWNPEDMKDMLTEDYFAAQTIKDPQAHQRLKEVLKYLKYDDNPVVVVAKLK